MKPTDLFDLHGKVAIVTGGGNGIGAACCRMLANYGASVVVADWKAADAKKVAHEVTTSGGTALAMECNVLRDDDLVALVDRTLSEYGGIQILVNNAGGGGAGKESPFEISLEQFERPFQINVFSAWRRSGAAVRTAHEEGRLRFDHQYVVDEFDQQKPRDQCVCRLQSGDQSHDGEPGP